MEKVNLLQRLLSPLRIEGLTIVDSKNFVFIIDSRNDNIRKYRYYHKKDVLLEIETGVRYNFGIFKLLYIFNIVHEDIIKHNADRETIFEEYIKPYLIEQGYIVTKYLSAYIISHSESIIEPFVYYPTSGNAVRDDKISLGILLIYDYE